MTATEKLAEFVRNTHYEDIPKPVLERAKLSLLDQIGVTLAGSKDKAAKMVFELAQSLGGASEATIVGSQAMTTILNASFVNGTVGHILELDDVCPIVGHPGTIVVPAALAAAEKEKADGKELLMATLLGYDIHSRIAKAVMPSHYRFWHTTSTCGCFGAAAAVGRLLQLSVDELVNALGIAGTLAFGLLPTLGTMSKPIHAGRAAETGVLAVLLAKKGFLASGTILEGAQGFCYATCSEPKLHEITKDFGKNFGIMEISIKMYATCGASHAAIDKTIEILREEHVPASDIEEVNVEICSMGMGLVGERYDPKTIAEAKFSLPYHLAVATLEGDVGIDQFAEEKIRDERILRIARKVKVSVNHEFDELSDGARVSIRTRKGEVYTRTAKTRRGRPPNQFTNEEIERKFRTLASRLLPPTQVEDLLKTISRLDRLGDMYELTRLLQRTA